MEDQNLIVAVCRRPVLYDTTMVSYDTTMVSYRDRNKKERAWVNVAEDTGFPVDRCRRKWKSLRDRETSSNLPRGAEEVEEDGDPETSLSGAGEDEELEEAAAGPSHNTGTKRKRARIPEGNTNMQGAILQALQRQNAVPRVTSPLYRVGAFEYSLRTDSDLGSDATPTLQAFYYFARSLEENMDATRKAVVAVALAEDQAIQ
ncbi:unnamed protein product [Boreogadus saida]